MCGRGCGEVWGGLGTVGGLACPKTLARTVEMWEVRAAVFWGSGAGLVALKRSRGCGTVGGPSGGPPTNSTSRLQHTAGQASGGVGSEQSLPKSDLAKTIQGLGEVGPGRGSGEVWGGLGAVWGGRLVWHVPQP